MSSKVRRRKTSQDAAQWSDGTQARRARERRRERLLWRRVIITMPLAFEKRKKSKEKSCLPSAFRRRVPFHGGRGHPNGKIASGAALASLPRAQQKRGEFSAFRCVYIREGCVD